jgi:hypothetical protein
MAKTFSELPAITTLATADLIAVDDVSDTPPAGGTTKKATIAQVLALASENSPSGTDGQLLTSDGADGFGTPVTPPAGSLVGTTATQTLSAKTLSSPTIQQTGSHAVLFQGTRLAMKSVVGEIQTSAASAATVVSYTMSDETHCQFDAIVTFAARTAVTKAGTYKLSVAYRRTGAAAPTIVGALTSQTAQETEANTVTIDVSGNDVRVRFTAADTDGRNVSCELRVQETTAA